MTTSIAYDLAKQFVENENLSIPAEWGFKYGLGELIEFAECFYFNYKLLNLDGQDYDGTPLAGAPGFIITKTDQNIRVLTFGELAKLKRVGHS